MTRPAIHRGEILVGELEEVGISQTELARQIDVPPNHISQIINGRRSITGDTALRLAHWFGTPPQFGLNLQMSYDFKIAENEVGNRIDKLPTRFVSSVVPHISQ